LEKHQEDFEGWMMLAEMYTSHFNDLPQADRTIRDLCQQPNITNVQISIALHRLADWHLKLGNDPDAACAALVELCRSRPNSFRADGAIAHQPASSDSEGLGRATREKNRIPLSAAPLDDPEETVSKTHLSPEDALAMANDYTAKLRQDPNNVLARERFAIVLAEHLGKVDLALEQLEGIVINIIGWRGSQTQLN
jgi:hypothetical protein